MTTKQQEREALQKIMTIIAELGEGSYIGKAFEGCEEVARENIDNDFFDSWKDRCESARKEAASRTTEASRLQAEVNTLTKQNAQLKAENDRMTDKALEVMLRGLEGSTLICLLNNTITAHRKEAERCAKLIVERADHPEVKEFKEAVEGHREHMEQAKTLESILTKTQASNLMQK